MSTVVTGAAPQRGGFRQWITSPTVARILFPFVVLGIWYLIYYTIDSRIFPTPQKVLQFMWEEVTLTSGVKYGSVQTNLYGQFIRSIGRLTAGFVVALVGGTVLGLAMGLWKAVDAFFHDWVMAVLAMPALVWALFLGLAFGFGDIGPVLAVILAGVPFVIINVREGVRNTPKELFDMARAFAVPQNKITRHVLLPSLMPFFFAGVRYAYSIGWKALVITEVFASDRGMGWTIKFWYDANRTHGVIGYALFFIIFAMTLEKVVFDPLARRVFRWRPQIGTFEVPEEDFDHYADEELLIMEGAQIESETRDG